MFWKWPKHVVVLCSVCSTRMESIENLPAVGTVGELSIYRCDECGNRRTIKSPPATQAR